MSPAKLLSANPVRTILVVEDHDGMRTMLMDWLAAAFPPHRLISAKSGEEAVTLTRAQYPDLVIMDVVLPQMNGIEATRKIKHIAPQVKVIMLSMYEAPEYQADAVQAGAIAYVLKRKLYTKFLPVVEFCLTSLSQELNP
jgi:DNA-binding NarL/FixJ family response regulator